MLDGYVTEHSRIKREISELYKHLITLEQDPPRILAMYEWRHELLQSLVQDINPHAFENLWVELAIDLQVICHSIFDCYYEKIKAMKKIPQDSMLETMNKYGTEAIKVAERIIKLLIKKEEKFEYTQVIINKRLSIGQICTKLYFKEISEWINSHKNALDNYKLLKSFLDEY